MRELLWAIIALGGAAGMWRAWVAGDPPGVPARDIGVFERAAGALVVGLPFGASAGFMVAALLAVVLP